MKLLNLFKQAQTNNPKITPVAPFTGNGGINMKLLEDYDRDLIGPWEKEQFFNHYKVFSDRIFQMTDDLRVMPIDEMNERLSYYKKNLQPLYENNKYYNDTKEGSAISALYVAMKDKQDTFMTLRTQLYHRTSELLRRDQLPHENVRDAVQKFVFSFDTVDKLVQASKHLDQHVDQLITTLYTSKPAELVIRKSVNEKGIVRLDTIREALRPELADYLEDLALEKWRVDNFLPAREGRVGEYFIKPIDRISDKIGLAGLNQNAFLFVTLDRSRIKKYDDQIGQSPKTRIEGMQMIKYQVISEQKIVRDHVLQPLVLEDGTQVLIEVDIYLSWQKIGFNI